MTKQKSKPEHDKNKDKTIGIIFPTFWPITDETYKQYGGLEPRTTALAKYFAEDGYNVKVLAPKGSHLNHKNIRIYNGDFFSWNGKEPVPYLLEKNLVECNTDVLKQCDVVLEDDHFGFFRWLKSCHPDEYPLTVNSWDHHCFTYNVEIKTVSENGRIQIQPISNLKGEQKKKLTLKRSIVDGDWFKESLKTELFKIVLTNGFSIDAVTADHLHLTNNGLKSTLSLNENDSLPISLYMWETEKLGSYNLGWLIGFIGAEGSINVDDISISQKNSLEGRTNIERVHCLANEFGHYCNYYETEEGMINLKIGKSILSLITSFIGGKTARTKYLKNKVWNSSIDFRKGLWQGWHDGDRNGEGISTYSKLLVEGLSILLRSLGILTSVKEKISKGFSSNMCYTVRPYKRTQTGGFFVSNIENDLEDSNIVWVKIKSVEVSHRDIDVVYDYHVNTEDHLFELANGIITHNCDNLSSLPNYPQNIITVSKWTMSALREKFKHQNHKFWHAYSGLIRDNYPEEFDLKDKEENLWLFLARFSTVKGPDIVIELAKQFKDDNFVLIGDVLFSGESHYVRTLKEVADSLDNVEIIFNASYKEKIEYLKRCTGLLHPGRWAEPLGWNLLEGLYFGSKLLAFDLGSIREVYHHEEHGAIVPFSNNDGNNIEMYKRSFRSFKNMKIKPEVCRQRILDNFDFKKLGYPVYEEVMLGIKNENPKI